jgi:protein phosphatase
VTEREGEGMVAKPLSFNAHCYRGLLKPAIKCRGREYLRIIHGPDDVRPDDLARHKKRGPGLERSVALMKFEALQRFVEHSPIMRVHRCVFGVLAMESASIDIRL